MALELRQGMPDPREKPGLVGKIAGAVDMVTDLVCENLERKPVETSPDQIRKTDDHRLVVQTDHRS